MGNRSVLDYTSGSYVFGNDCTASGTESFAFGAALYSSNGSFAVGRSIMIGPSEYPEHDKNCLAIGEHINIFGGSNNFVLGKNIMVGAIYSPSTAGHDPGYSNNSITIGLGSSDNFINNKYFNDEIAIGIVGDHDEFAGVVLRKPVSRISGSSEGQNKQSVLYNGVSYNTMNTYSNIKLFNVPVYNPPNGEIPATMHGYIDGILVAEKLPNDEGFVLKILPYRFVNPAYMLKQQDFKW